MLRIILSVLFSFGMFSSILTLYPEGNWLSLAELAISSFGFGDLVVLTVFTKQ